MCDDYVHLDNLSDISAYRNHNVQLCKMQINGADNKVNRSNYDTSMKLGRDIYFM